MYYSIITGKRYQSVQDSLKKINQAVPEPNLFGSFPDKIYNNIACERQERYEDYVRNAKGNAESFLASIEAKPLSLFGKGFVLMDKAIWKGFKGAQDFLFKHQVKEVSLQEDALNLSRHYSINFDHMHCHHG
jgi:hypothetical protein